MEYALIDDARRDYFAGGCVFPSVDELKKTGRWDRLDKEWQEWYIRGERCGEGLSPEVLAKFRRCAQKFAARAASAQRSTTPA